MLVTSAAKAKEFALPVNGRLAPQPWAASTRPTWASAWCPCRRKALEKAWLTIGDVDVVEANEAYASVALAVQRSSRCPTRR